MVFLWLVLLIGILPEDSSAAEITPFRLMDYSAYLHSQTSFDDVTIGTVGGMTNTTQLFTRREVGAATKSYIYHPNLLQMDVSGSIFQEARSLTNNDTETDDSAFSWNLGAYLDFLKNKPYPLTLFFTQNNQPAFTGLAETFTLRTRNYGANLRLLSPLTPVSMNISAQRSTSQGDGAGQVIDNTNDLINFRARYQFYPGNQTDFTYTLYHGLAASGSTNLPVRTFENIEHRASLFSDWSFGKEQQYRFKEIFYFTANDDPGVISISVTPLFDWVISSQLRSSFSYNFSTSDRPMDNADSLEHNANALLRYQPFTNLTGTFEVEGSHAELGMDTLVQEYGLRTTASYYRPVPYGQLGLGGSAAYNFNHREASIGQTQILDEAHTLRGTTSVPLNTEFIFPESIVVTNTTQTQTFIEGVDYLLTVIGATTFVERLVGSPNMTDPQDVLIDYTFDPGGTFDFTSVGLSVTANLSLARYYNLFARYYENDLTLTSGVSTTPLNSSRSIEVGASADVPLPWWGLRVGADARYLRQFEDINGFETTDFNAHLSMPLPYQSVLLVSGSRSLTKNDNSPLGGDSIGFSANVRSVPWRYLLLNVGTNYAEDTGGLFKVTRAFTTFDATFRLRRVSITANVTYEQQSQGDLDRDSLRAMINARRDIW